MNNLVQELTLAYNTHSRSSASSNKAKDVVIYLIYLKGVVGKVSMFKTFYSQDIIIYFIQNLIYKSRVISQGISNIISH